MESQRLITRHAERMQLAVEHAVADTAACDRGQLQARRLRGEMGYHGRCRTLEGEVEAAHAALLEPQLPQMCRYGRAPSRARVEIHFRIEARQRHAIVKDVRPVRGGENVWIVERSVDRAVRLDVAAAARRQQTEILGGHRELQVDYAIHRAIEGEAGAAEAHTDLLECPGVTRMRELAAAARRQAPEPPAEPVNGHADGVARLEAAARDRDPEIDTARQVGPHLTGIDAGGAAADIPALHRGPG